MLFPSPQRDRLASDLAVHLDQEMSASRKVEPKSNPFGSAWLEQFDVTHHQTTIHWGMVVDAVPLLNAYQVQGEYGQIIICTLGSTTGHQPTGVRQNTMLPVGTAVYYIVPPNSYFGTIFLVDPGFFTDPRNMRHDYVVQGSRSGLYSELAHSARLTRLAFNGGMGNFNAGRPHDSTTIGEWGFGAETGLAIHMDPFLAYMRADEETGLFLFYLDQMMRLSGHNSQIRSSVGEMEDLDDQLELVRFGGSGPYPWERLGAWSPGLTLSKTRDPGLVQTQTPEYSILEPLFDDQQAFNRHQIFEGYLGQPYKRIICLPPYVQLAGVNRLSNNEKLVGVFEEHNSLDGGYAMQSAKRVYFSKRVVQPVPKLIQRQESELGDNQGNYKAAGYFGAGEAHKIIDELATGDSVGPINLVRAAAILDLGAFIFNWQGVHPFFYHQRDWYLPEECQMAPVFQNQVAPTFCDLQDDQYLPAPMPLMAQVDHRYGFAKYYPNESFFTLLEDGGIMMGDGFGASITMTGGSIWLQAPGDINIMPGKNVNCWAGWDFIAKANNSADITANNKDVRLKAEHDIQIISGNDGSGGTLIESRATCPAYTWEQGEDATHSGIILAARNAPIATYSSDLYLRTRTNSQQPGSGNVVIRAGDASDRDVKIYCNNQESFLSNARFDFFSGSANEFWNTSTLFGSDTRINGRAVITDGLSVDDWISVVGHISTSEAGNFSGLVAQLSTTSEVNIDNDASDIDDRETYLVTTLMPAIKFTMYEEDLDKGITVAEGTLRSVDNYQTDGFYIFEARWQQMARLASGEPGVWTENPVPSNIAGNTFPHPGREVLEGDSLYQQDLTLYSLYNGASIDRLANQADYEEPEYGLTTVQPLQGNYTIIRSQ